MPFGDPPPSCQYWPDCGCGMVPCGIDCNGNKRALPLSTIPPVSNIDQLMARVDLLILLATDLKARIEATDKKMDAVWNGQNLVQQGIRELAEVMRTVGLTGYSKRKGDVFAIKGAGPSDQGDPGEDQGSS